jgi:hypothetical protein
MTTNTLRKMVSCFVSASILSAINIAALPSVGAQVTLRQCDQIQDRERRQRCRSAVYDAQRYKEEEHDWKDAEREIRARHERACRQVGMVARFSGSGRYLTAACVAPRIINDARNR